MLLLAFAKKHRHLWLASLLIWLGSGTLLWAGSSSFPVSDSAEYWEDRSGTAGLDALPADPGAWHSFKGHSNFGFTVSAIWVRFTLPESMMGLESLILLFRYSLIDDVQLFMPEPDGKGHKLLTSGRKYPVWTRTFHTQDLALEIPLVHQIPKQTFYLRMQTQGSAQFPFDLLTLHSYFDHAYYGSLSYRIFMGSMLIMILYNLIFFAVTRVFSYLAYVIYISCSTLSILSLYGIT